MYSDLDIAFALISESNDYSRQCYQKLVERSLDNEDANSTDYDRTKVDSPQPKMRKSLE